MKEQNEACGRRTWEDVAHSKLRDRQAAIQPFLTDAKGVIPCQENPRDITLLTDVDVLVGLMATGELSAEQVTRAFIKRAAKAQQQTNCFTEVMFSDAIFQAKHLDEHFKTTGKLVGPFHGVPTTVKDQFNVKGYDTTLGYIGRAYKPAASNALVVDTLQSLGCIIIAKTNLPQSIMWCETENPLFGLTTNPLDPSFTPGGSTGGEGCALSLGASMLGWGTDIGGSIRIPSHMNGLYGFKPTSSRLSYHEVPVSTEGQQHVPSAVGPMARSLASLVAVTKAMIDAQQWTVDPAVTPLPWNSAMFNEAQSRPLTIGILVDDGVVKCHPPIARVLYQMTTLLKAAGHEVLLWDPSLHADCIEVMDQYYTADGGEGIKRDIAAGGEPMIPHVEALVNRAPAISVYEYWQLNRQKISLQKRYYDKWNAARGGSGRHVDALLSPVMPHTALPHRGCRWVGYTKVWNFLDYPAVVFPAGNVDKEIDVQEDDYQPRNDVDKWNWERYDRDSMHGHPVGLQFVTRRFQEERALGVVSVAEGLLKAATDQPHGAVRGRDMDWASFWEEQK